MVNLRIYYLYNLFVRCLQPVLRFVTLRLLVFYEEYRYLKAFFACNILYVIGCN